MSEIIPLEDPEPQPEYQINLETGMSYEGPAARHYCLANLLRAEEERTALTRLTRSANHLLSTQCEVVGDRDDLLIRTREVLLRRRLLNGNDAFAYFFTVGDYHRSWRSDGDLVHYCHDDQRHEPADDVREKLEMAFRQERLLITRTLGGRMLAKLRRESQHV